MFTGIVQGVGRVVAVQVGSAGSESAGASVLDVAIGELANGLKLGASVAVNGTCLTATAVTGDSVRFDLVQETREQTNLGELGVGDSVNVERSFRVGDEVGGHLLSGHICSTAKVADVTAEEGHRLLTVAVQEQWMSYLMPKGFVSLNGASLTIQALDRRERTFTVSLIPETLARTTFDSVTKGDRLNLEVDGQTQAVVETVRAMLPTLMRSSGASAK